MSISPFRYTSEEGMEIANDFIEEALAQVGTDYFRLLAVSGSVGRMQHVCHDIDIVVVGVDRCTENFDHPIYEIKQKFIEAGKVVDVIPVFRRGPLGQTGWFYQMSARLVNGAIPLYENPVGYLNRLKGVMSKNPDHYLDIESRASLLEAC